MVTRRHFLLNCCSATALTALAPVLSINALAIAGKNLCPLDSLSYRAFASQINTTFRLRISDIQIARLRLAEARSKLSSTVINQGASNANHEIFSLIFLGPSSQLIDPGIYLFEHRTLGSFNMYIGNVDRPGPDGALYESIFNRPVKPGITN